MKTKILAMLVLLFAVAGVFFALSSVSASDCPREGLEGGFLFFDRPLVPCGTHNSCYPNTQKPCTICHLLVLVNNIYNLLLSLLIIASLLMLVISGTLYLLSGANSGLKTLAKGILTKTLVGFGIFLLSWLIVYTILVFISANTNFLGNGGDHWYEFSCNTESAFYEGTEEYVPGGGSGGGTGGTGGGTGGTGGGTGGGGDTGSVGNIFEGKTEAEAREILSRDYNIEVWETRPGATNVKDLRQESIDGVIAFQRDLGASILITGGAEGGGPHTSGTYSHANGYKVDIEDTAAVNSYIFSTYTPVGTRSDGAAMYSDGKGNIYAKESTHWDVCYNCGS